MARKRLTADEVSTSAKLAGVPPALALAIWEQESGGGANTKTSGKGARGDFQVTPATFAQYNPGGNINDPVDNMNGALNYMAALLKKYDGDWEKVGQAYYHGSALAAGAEGPTSGPGTPTTRQYGKQIVAKALKYDTGTPSMSNLATSPAGVTSTAKPDAMMGNTLTMPPGKVPAGRQTPSGPWIDPIWHNLTAQAAPGTAPMAMGDMGPQAPAPTAYAGPDDQQQMAQGGDEYDLDQYLRKLVGEIV